MQLTGSLGVIFSQRRDDFVFEVEHDPGVLLDLIDRGFIIFERMLLFRLGIIHYESRHIGPFGGVTLVDFVKFRRHHQSIFLQN